MKRKTLMSLAALFVAITIAVLSLNYTSPTATRTLSYVGLRTAFPYCSTMVTMPQVGSAYEKPDSIIFQTTVQAPPGHAAPVCSVFGRGTFGSFINGYWSAWTPLFEADSGTGWRELGRPFASFDFVWLKVKLTSGDTAVVNMTLKYLGELPIPETIKAGLNVNFMPHSETLTTVPLRRETIVALAAPGCTMHVAPVARETIVTVKSRPDTVVTVPVRPCTTVTVKSKPDTVVYVPVRPCTTVTVKSKPDTVVYVPVRPCTTVTVKSKPDTVVQVPVRPETIYIAHAYPETISVSNTPVFLERRIGNIAAGKCTLDANTDCYVLHNTSPATIYLPKAASRARPIFLVQDTLFNSLNAALATQAGDSFEDNTVTQSAAFSKAGDERVVWSDGVRKWGYISLNH